MAMVGPVGADTHAVNDTKVDAINTAKLVNRFISNLKIFRIFFSVVVVWTEHYW